MYVSDLIKEANKNRVQSLNLSNLGLPEVPPEISQLANLKVLNLRKNKISSVPPSVFPANLEVIYLDNNQIHHIDNGFFERISLKVLNLSNNSLVDLPESIKSQTSLRRLFLGSNKLKSYPESISDLLNLEVLSLSYNQIKSVPSSINNLKKLVRLDLSNNQLKEIKLDFNKATELEQVFLHSNELISVPTSLPHAKNLTLLSIFSNKITSVSNVRKCSLPGLDLNLADNLISDLTGSFRKLRRLHLYFNPLKCIQDGQVIGIKEYYIDRSQIQSYPERYRTGSTLKIIDTEENKVATHIYKVIPSAIEEKYDLTSRRQQLSERLRKT